MAETVAGMVLCKWSFMSTEVNQAAREDKRKIAKVHQELRHLRIGARV